MAINVCKEEKHKHSDFTHTQFEQNMTEETAILADEKDVLRTLLK